MTLVFPKLPRSQESFTLANTARLGAVTLGGTQQAVANPASFWKGRLGLRLRTEAHFLALRGFLASVDGQAGTFTVGPIDWRGQPWYRDSLFGGVITPGIAARSARQNGGSDSYEDSSSKLDFSLAEDVQINAVKLSINRKRGGLLQVGQYLQLGDRLHIITELVSGEAMDGSGRATPGVVQVGIRPWTWAAFGGGTVVNFENPTAIMRLADPDLPAVEMTTSPVGDVTLNLVEA